jgi:hypothetical protein
VSDILAGSLIRAADWPVSVSATDGTSIANMSGVTTYTAGSPVVDVTFVAPTSGRVLITVTLGARDNGGTNQIFLAPEVYLGTSAAGTLVLSTTSTLPTEARVPGEADDFMYVSRTCLLSGLTAGSTYYARTMHKTSGGTTADIARREIAVRPTP